MSSAVLRCAVSLLSVLLLVQAQLAVSTQFSFHFATAPGASYAGVAYSVTYTNVVLTGVETAPGSGQYLITGATGTRVYDSFENETLSGHVNFGLYEGVTTDNILYYPEVKTAFLDSNGISFTLSSPQTIFPGTAPTTHVNLFFGEFGYGEAISNTDSGTAQYTCSVSIYTPGAGGDPVFYGFNGQRFIVKGLPDRVYNILSLPSLQLNTRFIPLSAGQAMNHTQQTSVRQRQSRLIAALGKAAASAGSVQPLPSTTTWSHAGQYMGESGVQVAGHRLYVVPGAYSAGFQSVQLDGAELPVSSEAVQLMDGTSTITRPSSSVLSVQTAQVSFTLVNSDHFLNIHHAELDRTVALKTDSDHVDGILGQTADTAFTVQKTAEWKQHVETDFLIPAGEDELWSTAFEHNQYVMTAGSN